MKTKQGQTDNVQLSSNLARMSWQKETESLWTMFTSFSPPNRQKQETDTDRNNVE